MIRKSAFNKKIQEEQMGFTSDYARWKREGEEKGREEGFADGLEKGKGNTIETLLRKGALTASQIAEYLDIPLSEVCRIAENIDY